MRTNLFHVYSGALALAISIPTLAAADSIKLRHDDVIPIVIQTELSFTNTRAGDVFRGDVSDSHMLPLGSRVEGVVNRVVKKDGKKKAFMDIEFTTIILPDGHRTEFHATPIPLSKQYVTQDRDGRWEAKKGVSKDTVVLGSTAGGLILGSMIHKPFEGAFLGVIIGVIAGETNKQDVSDGDLVVPKGSKIGARVDEDLVLQFDGQLSSQGPSDQHFDKDGYNSAGYDRYGFDRKGHYDPKFDTTRDAVRTDRDTAPPIASNGYDRYGYDKDGHYDPKYDTTRTQPAPGRSADREMQIEIDHKVIHYTEDERPFRKNWIVMVPIRSTAEQLGYKVNKTHTGTYRVENDSDILVVEQDSRTYSLNTRQGPLPRPVEIRDGVAYVPIDAFTSLTKGAVTINGTKYRQSP